MPTRKNTERMEKAWNKSRNQEKNKIFPTAREVSQRWVIIKQAINRESKARTLRYLQNSSINCYRYLADDTLQWEEKLLWWCVYICAMAATGYVVWVTATKASLTATSRNPDGISVSNVPYPGLALCSVNKLSKTKVGNLAKEIIANGHSEYSEMELVFLLGYLGLTFDFEDAPNDELEVIHNLIFPYNLGALMQSLAPDCEELLVRCIWRNEVKNCSELFTLQKTSEGYCCTFNYIRDDFDFVKSNSSENERIMGATGQDLGLSVLMNPQLEDYLYTRMPNLGIKVMIFNPSDFPDVPSGGCLEQIISPMTEQFITMDATVVSSTAAIDGLPFSVRGCLVEKDETIYNSYSDCVITCRVKSSMTSCGCVPFFLPPGPLGHSYCDLMDNSCMRKWKRSWENAWSGDDQALESSETAVMVEKGPPCAYCVPACSDTSYRAQRYSVNLQPEAINSENDSEKAPLKRGIIFKDHSALHVFFDKDSFTLLNNDILSSWYDWMSSLGGLIGLFLGYSVLSLAEIVYFILGGPAKGTNTRIAPPRELYWQELRRL